MGFFRRPAYRQKLEKCDVVQRDNLKGDNNHETFFKSKLSSISTDSFFSITSMTNTFLSKDGHSSDTDHSAGEWELEEWRLSSLQSDNEQEMDRKQSAPSKHVSLAEFSKLRCSMSYKSHIQVQARCEQAPVSAPVHSTSNQKKDTCSKMRSLHQEKEAQATDASKNCIVEDNTKVNNEPQLKPTFSQASLIASQARRALQQMMLSSEEDDDLDSDYEDAGVTGTFIESSMMKISKEDFNRFQVRLDQLEKICAEQGQKQSEIEKYIAEEVNRRTKVVLESNNEQIALYRKAKDMECENAISARLNKCDKKHRRSVRQSLAHRFSHEVTDAYLPSRLKRHNMVEEKVQQQEVQDMQQFVRKVETECAVKAENSKQHLMQVIDILHEHLRIRDEQMDEAEKLIQDAIIARAQAEDAAKEAIELTLDLDERLGSMTQEIFQLKHSKVEI